MDNIRGQILPREESSPNTQQALLRLLRLLAHQVARKLKRRQTGKKCVIRGKR